MLRGTAKTEELLPDRWKAAHSEAVREYREQERRDKADTAVLQTERRSGTRRATPGHVASVDLSCKSQLRKISLRLVYAYTRNLILPVHFRPVGDYQKIIVDGNGYGFVSRPPQNAGLTASLKLFTRRLQATALIFLRSYPKL